MLRRSLYLRKKNNYMKIKELREKNSGELNRILVEKKEIIRKIRFDIASKQVKNTKDLGKAKKDIARILTIIKES
ncbi:MAG: 50S ribosomal protein L29 [Candidatus Moranbacteria bacterium CG10_big_fil_rev_8_21_14_0_10_35_21]|nr:MAG: 50S ribosomal protein L29 [Candidatus Moranbacteria bacterium CG10_big_fil_rev_8_21_14_0_10_35_21]PJA88776.1 MAG: 50S ribosomal protein L29 [Candidatus Moranbacteria bacterium CG_4_9_14_3_um_filter_36_9]